MTPKTQIITNLTALLLAEKQEKADLVFRAGSLQAALDAATKTIIASRPIRETLQDEIDKLTKENAALQMQLDDYFSTPDQDAFNIDDVLGEAVFVPVVRHPLPGTNYDY